MKIISYIRGSRGTLIAPAKIMLDKLKYVSVYLHDHYNERISVMGNKNNKVKTTEPVQRLTIPVDGFFGLLMVFVLGSIAFTSYMVIMGTHGIVPLVMVSPQVLFFAGVVLYKFSK